MKPFLPSAIIAALLGGCAATPPAPDASAAAGTPTALTPVAAVATPVAAVQTTLPPAVTGPINGIYQGSSEQVAAKVPGCPYAAQGLIEIGDRTLLFPYTYELIYVAPVQADGTVHASVGDTVLDGTLIDGRLTFNVNTPVCQSTFSFRRQSGF